MRLTKILLLMSVLIIIKPPSVLAAEPYVSAQNAILMDQETGEVLYEVNGDEQTSIASITKIMTAIIAIELGVLSDEIETSELATLVEGSSIYLEQDEVMTLEDLLYGLLLRSGNDAAIAISEHIGGSEEGFVFLMNEKAKWLGMTNSHFTNPHGLHDEDHYSTAYDMALLMKYAMNNKKFQEISGTKNYQSDNRTYLWKNKNRLLTDLYSYCTGGKTGYTKNAGRTLVTTANKDDRYLIAVTLNAPNDWEDHKAMFEWGFQQNPSTTSAIQTNHEENDRETILTYLTYTLTKILGMNQFNTFYTSR